MSLAKYLKNKAAMGLTMLGMVGSSFLNPANAQSSDAEFTSFLTNPGNNLNLSIGYSESSSKFFSGPYAGVKGNFGFNGGVGKYFSVEAGYKVYLHDPNKIGFSAQYNAWNQTGVMQSTHIPSVATFGAYATTGAGKAIELKAGGGYLVYPGSYQNTSFGGSPYVGASLTATLFKNSVISLVVAAEAQTTKVNELTGYIFNVPDRRINNYGVSIGARFTPSNLFN